MGATSSASLRLFLPPTSIDPDPPLTLRRAFALYRATHTIGKATATIYETTLRHWERLTPDPDLRELGDRRQQDALCRDWYRALRDNDGQAPDTALKYWRCLRALFRHLAQPGDRNPDAEGFLDRVPCLRPDRSRRSRRKRIASVEELNALYEACHVARYPRSPQFSTCDLWRCLIVLEVNAGPRTWDLLSRDWPAVDWVGKTLTVHQEKVNEEIEIPLGKVSIAHLLAIRGERKRIFPVTRCRRSFYKEWKRIKSAAGLVKPLDLQDLRRTCQTRYDSWHFGVGDLMTGHAAADVGGRYYRDLWDKAVEAVDAIPQPQAFLDGLHTLGNQRQLMLF